MRTLRTGVAVGLGGGDNSCADATLASVNNTAIRNLSIATPVHIWEQVILRFALREKIAIDLSALKLVGQLCEPCKMIAHSFSGVIFRGVVANEEGPIAGLRKKKLAHELAQDAFVISSRLSAARFYQCAHPCVRHKKVWVNPATFLIQPDIEETMITPAR